MGIDNRYVAECAHARLPAEFRDIMSNNDKDWFVGFEEKKTVSLQS
jgi:hypothetical protein